MSPGKRLGKDRLWCRFPPCFIPLSDSSGSEDSGGSDEWDGFVEYYLDAYWLAVLGPGRSDLMHGLEE